MYKPKKKNIIKSDMKTKRSNKNTNKRITDKKIKRHTRNKK